MVHNVPYQVVPDAQRLFEYALAYLTSAIDTAEGMATDTKRASWPYAAVTSMLASHSTELFLKAILLRAQQPFSQTHDLQSLQDEVRRFGISIGFHLPMTYEGFELPASFRSALKKEKALSDPSIVNRYPFAEPGKEWRSLHAIEPALFARELRIARGLMTEFWET